MNPLTDSVEAAPGEVLLDGTCYWRGCLKCGGLMTVFIALRFISVVHDSCFIRSIDAPLCACRGGPRGDRASQMPLLTDIYENPAAWMCFSEAFRDRTGHLPRLIGID